MVEPDEQALDFAETVEAIRGPIRRLAACFPDKEPIDIAVGALYASHDLAMRSGMDAHEATAWIGVAARMMERQLLDRAKLN